MLDENPIASLDEILERSFSDLGELDPNILGRLTPQISDNRVILWPWNALGRQRIIRRAGGGVLFVTQGLSYPFDPSIHGPDIGPLGYELAIEVPGSDPVGAAQVVSSSNEALANTWPVQALWFLSKCYLEDHWELFPRLRQFGGLITGFVPPLPGIEHLSTPQRFVGAVVGMPLTSAAPFSVESQHLLAQVDGHESRLITLKLITPDEYAYATSVNDSARALELAEAFRRRGEGHVSSAVLPSVLQRSF